MKRFLVMVVAALAVAACGDGGPRVQCMRVADKRDADEPPRPPPKMIARVDRCSVSLYSFRFAYSMFGHVGEHGHERVVDALIARELLAQGAQEAGDRALSDDEVERRIRDGELYALGQRLSSPSASADDGGGFDYQQFRRLAANAGVTVAVMVAEQAREMLALKMRARLGDDQIDGWLSRRCRRAAAAGRLTVEPDVIARFDDNGKEIATSYVPCAAWAADTPLPSSP